MLDLMDVGGSFVVQALLMLSNYVDQKFSQHDDSGTFVKRAKAEGRNPSEICKAWSRCGQVKKQLAEVLQPSPVWSLVCSPITPAPPDKCTVDCPQETSRKRQGNVSFSRERKKVKRAGPISHALCAVANGIKYQRAGAISHAR